MSSRSRRLCRVCGCVFLARDYPGVEDFRVCQACVEHLAAGGRMSDVPRTLRRRAEGFVAKLGMRLVRAVMRALTGRPS